MQEPFSVHGLNTDPADGGSHVWVTHMQSCVFNVRVMEGGGGGGGVRGGVCQRCWIAAGCAASSGVSGLWRLSIGTGVGSCCCSALLNFIPRRRHSVFVVCVFCLIKVTASPGHTECALWKCPPAPSQMMLPASASLVVFPKQT